jgi:hypothetical protein
MSRFNTQKFLLAIVLAIFLWCAGARPSLTTPKPVTTISFGSGRTLTSPDTKNTKNITKIQMQSEVVRIDLYPGVGVVKGEYHMVNTSPETVNLQVGYPINGFTERKLSDELYSDSDHDSYSDLYHLKVFVDDRVVSSNKIDIGGGEHGDKNEWYVWPIKFAAKQGINVMVYYMTDTWGSIGTPTSMFTSSSKELNLFQYILQSGTVWGKKIEKGTVYIKLHENLTNRDVLGVRPPKILRYNTQDHSMIYRFTNLKPTAENNIQINYGDRSPSQDFATESTKFQHYYQEVDRLTIPTSDPPTLIQLTQNEFSIVVNDFDKLRESTSFLLTCFVSLLLLLVVLSIPGLVIVAIVLFLKMLFNTRA